MIKSKISAGQCGIIHVSLSSSIKRLKNRQERKMGNAIDKGLKGGSCNVTVCQRPNSAIYYNNIMKKYYCFACASEIQRFSPDYQLFDDFDRQGRLLCQHST